MVQYATASELASYLKQDVDTSTANQALTIASGLFNDAAGTSFQSTSSTYTVEGWGRWWVTLPFGPVITVVQVRVNGAVITDYTPIKDRVYRRGGFGVPGVFPPDKLEVDYTYGYTAVPDSVKGAVLESAAMAYDNPDPATTSESIDDYSVKTAPNLGGICLSPTGKTLALYYAGALVA